jgi:RNA-splicing ligase RtcB
LRINPKNDVIVRAKHGLKFLGHQIKSDTLRVDKNTSKSILEKVNSQNTASYRAMYLSKDIKRNLEWKVMQEIFDIIA